MSPWPLAECALKGPKRKQSENVSTRLKPHNFTRVDVVDENWGELDRFALVNVKHWFF